MPGQPGRRAKQNIAVAERTAVVKGESGGEGTDPGGRIQHPDDADFGKSLSDMCNLSEGVMEKSRAEGTIKTWLTSI